MLRGKPELLLLLALVTLEVCANPAAVKKSPPQVAASKAKTDGAATLPSVGLEVFFDRCPQLGPDWVKFGDACYWWSRNTSEYWKVAEDKCNLHGGHLTSVGSRFEDSLIAKLTYCRSSWIGLYAVNVDLLNQPSNYRWTDNSPRHYIQPHNFTGIPDIHHPLISTHNLQWINNVYHGRHSYVCKVNSPSRNVTCDCPTGWRQQSGYCYIMPGFAATYIEADFYCRGRNAYVTSLHTKQELRAMSLLDIESHGCPFDIWIGLLKLNPCRVDFSTGRKICYRWSDRSGDYNDLPAWQSGNPSDDQVTNCVLLQNEEIRTVPCHTRARFVCKKKVEPARSARQCQA